MMLLLYFAIRRKNLVSLHLERNLRPMGDGKVYLVYDASEVKNRRSLEFELPPLVREMLEEHLGTRSPHLGPAQTSWLFPRRDGRTFLEPSHFTRRICARIRKETGLEMHVHLFRHLVAKLVLEEHPGHYEVVRRLLGHSTMSAALSAYTGFEAGTAIRLHAELIARAQGILA